MKKNVWVRGLAFVAAFSGLSAAAPVFSQDAASRSQLTLPWEDFKKILRIDENEIVLPLETFNRLVALTGAKTPPAHAMRQGLVVLTRAEFQNLVDRTVIPPDSTAVPPFDYLITKSAYSGKMGRNGTAFTARFQVHVLKKNAYLKIPLLYQNIALEDLRVDGRPALVVGENGTHQAVISRPGEHLVEAAFNIKSNLDRGPFRLDLSILQTPITLFRLDLPLRGIDVDIPQAQAVSVEPGGAGTVVTAVIAPGGSISAAWRKKAPAGEKLPSKVYAEVDHLLSIHEDALRLNSDVVLTILHSEIDEVSLVLPNDWNLLGVSGEGVGDWREKLRNGQHAIMVPFTYGRQGTAVVNVVAEKPISDKGASNAFAGFRVLNMVRETGYVGVELNTGAEVKVAAAEALDRVAVSKLPPILYNKSAKPLILAYKYLRHPFSLVLDVEKHEKIAVPMASAVSANAVTLFTEDGKIVHRLIYQIRNSEKQFLEMRLPKGADVWSVFVGNEAVESSMGSDGRLLVPLIRSRFTGRRLETFPVEVIYCLSEKPFRLLSRRDAALPAVDVMTSQILWSVYVPNDYSYYYFKSTLEKEEIIRGLNLMGSRRRMLSVAKSAPGVTGMESEVKEQDAGRMYKGKDYKSEFRNVPMEEQQAARQLDAEMNFGGKLDELSQVQAGVQGTGAGVMPIQIEVPTTGQVYRFAKTIVKTEDPLSVGVWYARRGLVLFARWIFILLILLLAYRFRRWLRLGWDRLSAVWKKIRPGLLKAEGAFPRMLKSSTLPWLLAVLTVIAWFLSRWLFVLTLFLLWVVAVYRIILYFREKRKPARGVRKRDGKLPGNP
jgi:hypothetical protein